MIELKIELDSEELFMILTELRTGMFKDNPSRDALRDKIASAFHDAVHNTDEEVNNGEL